MEYAYNVKLIGNLDNKELSVCGVNSLKEAQDAAERLGLLDKKSSIIVTIETPEGRYYYGNDKEIARKGKWYAPGEVVFLYNFKEERISKATPEMLNIDIFEQSKVVYEWECRNQIDFSKRLTTWYGDYGMVVPISYSSKADITKKYIEIIEREKDNQELNVAEEIHKNNRSGR